MPPVTGTEGLGTPVLKDGQRNNISPIPPVASKASQKLSEDKMDLYGYFKRVEPAKASPKIPEDKRNLYDYFKKVKPPATVFEPSGEVIQDEGKEVEAKGGDSDQDCKTLKRKRKQLKRDSVYDQNQNPTNVLVSVENSSDKVCEMDIEEKQVVQLVSSDVDDFEDEIKMICDTKETGRQGVKSVSDKKEGKHTNLKNNAFLLKKKKDALSLGKKENPSGIKKNDVKQVIDKSKKKFYFITRVTKETLLAEERIRKNTSVNKEEDKDTSSRVENEIIIMREERAQNQGLGSQEKNGKAQTIKRNKKSGNESGRENDAESPTHKEDGSLNKTNAFSFMMATRHKQDEAILQMRLEDTHSSGDDDLEILEHKKTEESSKPGSASPLEENGKKELKKGTNAFALLMTKRQTPKKEEEVAQVTEITLSDSDSEDRAQRMSSTKQGDDKRTQKRKADDMNDSLHDFEVGLEKEKKRASKKKKKTVVGGNTSSCKSKGALKLSAAPEATASVGESESPGPKPETTAPVRVQVPQKGVECKSSHGHMTNSAETCGLTGDLRSVEVISFQDYMAACKKLLVSQSVRETSDLGDMSEKPDISKPSLSSIKDPNHFKSQDTSYETTNGKVQESESETGVSVKANTGPLEKVGTGLSEKGKPLLSKQAKKSLPKKSRTPLSKKVMADHSEKTNTEISEKSENGSLNKVKTDLSEKVEMSSAKKAVSSLSMNPKTGLAETDKTGHTKTDDSSLSENAMVDCSGKALTPNSEEVEAETSEKTVTCHPGRNESDLSEKMESGQEKGSNTKTKNISSFFRKLTKEESLQERCKITIVADVHATAEGSSPSNSTPAGQAKDVKAEEPDVQNSNPKDATVSGGEVKARKNKVEKVTPRRNARRKTRTVQEELEKIELLEQVTITEEDAGSQDKKSELLTPNANNSCSESKAKEDTVSFKNKAWGGSTDTSVENGIQGGSTLNISRCQDGAKMNSAEGATLEKMTSCQETFEEQTVEKGAPEVLKHTPVRRAKQMARDEPGYKSRKEQEQTPKKKSKQASKKKLCGKTAVVALTDTCVGKDPKLGQGMRSKKRKKPCNSGTPPEGAAEEPEEGSGGEDCKPQEDSCLASSWEDDGHEDKENIVKYESVLLEKPGNRISLRLRKLPQASYADKKKKVLSQIQGTAVSHSKVKAKALLSKAKSRNANLKAVGRKKKVNVGKKSSTDFIVGMMEVGSTAGERDDSEAFLEKNGKATKKSQVSGKKKLKLLQKKLEPGPKKGSLAKGKTGCKQKEGSSEKVKSKSSKTNRPEPREIIKGRPERRAAANARRFLEENEEVVEKAVKGHKNKESKGQSQTGTAKLAPIFMKKDSEKAVEVVKVLSPTKVKARQEFLMSGLPTEIKLQIAIEKSLEMNYGPQFPKISHVQQRDDDCKMWNLPAPQIKQLLESSSTPSIAVPENAPIFENRIEAVKRSHSIIQRPSKLCVNGLSRVLMEIKDRHPGVPVCSLFRSYLERKKEKLLQYKKEAEREKQQKCKSDVIVIDLEEEETLAGRKRKKKRRSGALSKRTKAAGRAQGRQSLDARKEDKEEEEAKVTEEEEDPWNERTPYMWTSLFAPRSGQEVIGNKDVVRRVRVWLLEWKRKCEVEARREMKRGKKKSKKDKDDFLTSDESNGFSDEETEDNTLLLTGPSGVGKSAVVYAMAKELGYKVLEVNASSKRNGKHVISQLAEATQSHRVSNSQSTGSSQTNTLVSMFASKTDKGGETGKSGRGILEALSEDSSQESGQDVDKKKAMSLVVFEDIDIVFEDADEGFMSAVQSFMATTKRPIILTTSQPTTPVLGRIKGEYEHLQLRTPDTPLIALHAQLACLAEGVCASARDLLCLVSLNCGDIRQTLLDLQLWSQSLQASKNSKKIEKIKLKVDDLPVPAILHEETPDLALHDLFSKMHDGKTVVAEYQQGCTVAKTGRCLILSSLTPSHTSLLSLSPELVHTSLPLISYLPLKIMEEKKKKYPLDPNDPYVKMTKLYERHSWLSLDDEEEEEASRAEEEPDKKVEVERESPLPEEVKLSVRKCMDTFSKLFDSLAFHDLLDAQASSSREPALDSWWWSSTVNAGLSGLPSSAAYNGTVQDAMAELEEATTGHSVTLWNQELKRAVEGIRGEWKELELPWSKSSSVAALMTGKADVSRIRSSNALQRSICDKIPVISRWNHRSFSLEYLPSIRAVTRMDELAAVVCEKRRARRFLSHLSQQSIHISPEERTALANVMQF